MAELTEEILKKIVKKAKTMAFGEIRIKLSENGTFLDVEYLEKVRFYDPIKPNAGLVLTKKNVEHRDENS